MKKSSIVTIVCLILLKILLEYNYISFVNPLYEYSGMILNISFFKLFESYILFIVLIILLIFLESYKGPSKIVVYILFVILYTPISSVYWLQNESRLFMYLITFSLIILVLILYAAPKIFLKSFTHGKMTFYLIVVIISIIVYGSLILEGGLTRLNLNLTEVYELREINSRKNNIFLAYLIPWQGYVVNLSVIGIAIFKKKYKITILFILFQLLLFAMTNFKSFLFAPLLIIVIYIFNKTKIREKYLLLLSLGSGVLVLFVMFIGNTFNSIMWQSILIRRLFFTPANLHYVFYNFFANNEKFYLSHSIFSGIIENQFESTPVGVVSRTIYHQESGANAGFFADAFANFGGVGLILFALLLGLLLKAIDSITLNIPIYISISVIIIPFMSIINSAFFTSLLTHGILFSIFILWLSKSFFIKN